MDGDPTGAVRLSIGGACGAEIAVGGRERGEAKALALVTGSTGGGWVRNGDVDHIRGAQRASPLGRVDAKGSIHGRHVGDAVAVSALLEQLCRIENKNHHYREDGDDRNDDQELDEGEGFTRRCAMSRGGLIA